MFGNASNTCPFNGISLGQLEEHYAKGTLPPKIEPDSDKIYWDDLDLLQDEMEEIEAKINNLKDSVAALRGHSDKEREWRKVTRDLAIHLLALQTLETRKLELQVSKN